jgi:threonine aldolase
MMGGTLRQVGVLAQPAIIGLTQMIEPLKEDNAMAKKLAEGLK